MTDLTRFSQDMDGSMEPDEDGEWVRAEVADELEALVIKLRLEFEQLQVQLAGCLTAAEGATDPAHTAKHGDYGWSVAYEQTLELRRRHDERGARLAALEAPPVVPDGWKVRFQNERWVLGYHAGTRIGLSAMVSQDGSWMSVGGKRAIPASAVAALLWAHTHNTEPPHAADGEHS